MMSRSVFLFIIVNSLCFVSSYNEELCGNNVRKTSSCTTQILGQDLTDSNTCKLEHIAPNSSQCINMKFGPLMDNNHIGRVSLSPYVMTHAARNNKNLIANYTILNITFINIKWNTMKFQFKNMNKVRVNHCSNIIISNNVTINDQSILYYDCFWQHTINNNRETPSYILQFEAMDDNNVVNTGRYYFNVPTANMLSETVNASQWKPFVYIEMLPNMMRLHIRPPPPQLEIKAYKVEVIKQCDDPLTPEKVLVTKVLKLAKNDSKEQTFDYNWLSSYGLHYFVVRPLHDGCKDNEASCQFVKSPTLDINEPVQTLSVCIVTIPAIVLVVLLVCFWLLKRLRHLGQCFPDKGYYDKTLPSPPKILVIYSGVNRLHARTVALLVKFLRHDCGFDVKYAGDLQSMVKVEPLDWANRAYEESTHIIVVAGPTRAADALGSYEAPVNAYENVNLCLMYFLGRIFKSKTPKEIANVLFDYSDPATIPQEAKHCKRFHLLKDRHKMIAHLSRNKLPRIEIDKSFAEHLSVAKKLLVDGKGQGYEV